MTNREVAIRSISRSESFSAALKTRPVAKSARLMLHVLPQPSGVELGILVPKRFAKRAVDRHTLKRLVRQACCLHLESAFTGQLLVRLVRPVASIPYSERESWWIEIQHLLKKC